MQRVNWKIEDTDNVYYLKTEDIQPVDNEIKIYYDNQSKHRKVEDISLIVQLDHIGVAVSKITKRISYYESLGYKCSKPILDPIQNVYLCMCEKEAYTRIELVSPVNETSPVISILEDYDNRPYHFCYAVNSIAMFLKDLEKNNIVYNIIKSPQEAILFNMQKVMFILVDAVGLIELRENVNLTYEQIDDIVLKNRVTIVTNDIT